MCGTRLSRACHQAGSMRRAKCCVLVRIGWTAERATPDPAHTCAFLWHQVCGTRLNFRFGLANLRSALAAHPHASAPAIATACSTPSVPQARTPHARQLRGAKGGSGRAKDHGPERKTCLFYWRDNARARFRVRVSCSIRISHFDVITGKVLAHYVREDTADRKKEVNYVRGSGGSHW